MQGKNKETYTGVAKFLDFLAKPEKRCRVASENRLSANHQSSV
ncbi:hypothetical protein ACLB1S_28590 [Escherichia coli]